MLGERQNLRDHKSRFADELIVVLRTHDVVIHRYYFQSDPRVCSDSKGAAYTLAELAAIHPIHEVWLWTNAERCIDPLTARPESWIADLRQWKYRVLLTSSPPRVELDMVTGAPTRAGLEAIALGYAPTQTSAQPTILTDRPERWLDPVAPPPAAISRLLAQLQRLLGPSGWSALKACAAYPGIAWNITATMVAEIVPAVEIEDVMYKLSDLPWFRHGSMPDWLRCRLVNQIGPNASVVRAALRKYLDKASEIAKERPEVLDFITRKAGINSGGRIRDHVYLNFLKGRKIDPLSLQAPGSWRRFKGYLWISPAIAAVLAIGGSIGTFIATNWLSDRITEAISLRQAEPAVRPGNQWVAFVMDVAEALGLPPNKSSIQRYSALASDLLSVRDPLVETGEIISAEMGAKILGKDESRPSPGFVAATLSGDVAIVRRDSPLGIEIFGSQKFISRAEIQWLADLNGVLLRPAEDDTKGAQTLPPIPSCVPSSNTVVVLSQIAQLYEETRQRMPLGDPRTARMTDLITAAIGCEKYVHDMPSTERYFRDFQKERDGFRIVALGLAEAAPKGRISFATEVIRKSRSAFEQYHGLMLARYLINSTNASERDELRAAIEGQIGKTITVADLSRWQPAQEMLKYLSSSVQERVPLLITVITGSPPTLRASGGYASVQVAHDERITARIFYDCRG